jgi:hypothetical protein
MHGMDGVKYMGPGLAAPLYRVTAENPIVDEARRWTRDEVSDRLDALKTVLGSITADYERVVVTEEIQRLEALLAQHKVGYP